MVGLQKTKTKLAHIEETIDHHDGGPAIGENDRDQKRKETKAKQLAC